MARRIKFLTQKRTSLRARIDDLTDLLASDTVDHAVVKLRSARLTELFHAFEEYNDELMTIDSNGNHNTEFNEIQARYYALTAKTDKIVGTASCSGAGTSRSEVNQAVESAPAQIRLKRIKLPEIKLPDFDGAYENWLSFKNEFRNVIDARTDLTDIDKLHYLKSALTGEAANKVKLFAVEGINYANAWEVLTRAYEVKRVLISRHLASLLNMPSVDKETANGLTKLADDAQQHVASLNALGVNITPELVVHLIESKLSKYTANRWEATINREQFPTPDQIYEFVYRSAVCASKHEKAEIAAKERTASESSAKRRRVQSNNRALVLNTPPVCVACKRRSHTLYMCDDFNKLTVPKRIELIKSEKLCYNCMRAHRARTCRFRGCTICHKRHNTLLHLERPADANSSASTSQTTSEKPPL